MPEKFKLVIKGVETLYDCDDKAKRQGHATHKLTGDSFEIFNQNNQLIYSYEPN